MKPNFNTPLFLLLAALAVASASLAARAQAPAQQPAAAPVELAEAAPTRYTVKKGDTLWSISARFLKSPWRWNELWRLNKDQLKSPHRIHPGDVLVLTAGADGQPQLGVESRPVAEERPTVRLSPLVRVTPIDNDAIPAIPPAIIDPFLTKPLIVGQDGMESAPRIVGGTDKRVVLATGDKAYVVGIGERDGLSWQVYRPGRPLSSPGKPEILGYEAEYLGDAVVDKIAEVSTVTIVSSRKEIVVGDRMVQVPKERIVNYPPHAPDKAVEGRIIGLPTSLIESGRDAVITLDLGSADGMEIGHVLAIHHNAGAVNVPDKRNTNFLGQPKERLLPLPQERIGLAFVFRTFDRVSYALVLNSNKQIELGDLVRKP